MNYRVVLSVEARSIEECAELVGRMTTHVEGAATVEIAEENNAADENR